MRKIYIITAAAAMLSAQVVFADMPSEGKYCSMIAKACVNAGYAKKEGGKKFWKGCMRPVLLGQTVNGVSIDPATVKKCRAKKIIQMKKELQALQTVSQ